jgi:hypothetical protein
MLSGRGNRSTLKTGADLTMLDNLYLRLLSVDRVMADAKDAIRFSAHSMPSNYSDVPFDTVVDGRIYLNGQRPPKNCQVFIRRISQDKDNVRVTLKFHADLEDQVIKEIEEASSETRIEILQSGA